MAGRQESVGLLCFRYLLLPFLKMAGGLCLQAFCNVNNPCNGEKVIFGLKTMGRKDASTSRTPVDQYRKQIGKQDYKKTRPMLRATRLKAEAKKTALGVKEVALVLAAILVFLLAFYAFFYLNVSNEVDLDLDPDEN
ncbi:triple QxxK/R motif-containing protein isoform X1 [Corvus cornix cornix]|nr:triple QxxK/R motif-containing protein isoform X1 [Corvus cornix cornix]XP_041891950.1 triple QxxK/R motif-containing protein isoform X2 [Corvus kubaryi]XP_048142690.1 triple QxxK/R motif-containing protein isoform X2 [Corvus hawaiiensis]